MTRKMVSGGWGAAALVAMLLFTAAPVEASPAPGSWVRIFTWLGSWSRFGTLLAATSGEEGVAIGPNGSRNNSSQGDAGPIIDPNGSWSTTGQGDAGPIIDPLGGKG